MKGFLDDGIGSFVGVDVIFVVVFTERVCPFCLQFLGISPIFF